MLLFCVIFNPHLKPLGRVATGRGRLLQGLLRGPLTCGPGGQPVGEGGHGGFLCVAWPVGGFIFDGFTPLWGWNGGGQSELRASSG